MTYAIRNSIIIFGLIIMVLILNTITKNKTEQELEAVNRIYNEKSTELSNLKRINPDLEKEKEIMAQHDVMQTKALNRTKFILKYDDPTLSYDYFTSIAERFVPKFYFDFRFEGSGTLNNTNYNKYALKGTSDLDKLFRFLYHLENQSALVKISAMNLEEKEQIVPRPGKKTDDMKKVLDFTINVMIFFDASGDTYEELAIQNMKSTQVLTNPFRAKIIKPQYDEESIYVNIDKAKIVGLSPETVTLQEDGKKVAVLEIGDRVLQGYLSSINWEEEYAVFKSDAYGVIMEAKLYLERE